FIGLLIVAGVYFYSRRTSQSESDSSSADSPSIRAEPVISGEDRVDLPTDVEDLQDPEPAEEQKIVTLRLVAKHQASFAGDDLVLNLRGLGMRHGKFGIFHQYEGQNEKQSVFCAASLVEPGSFDLVNLKDQQIPGISLFMVLPGPVGGAQAFDLMVKAARALSQSLNAELLDESGSTFSIQRERYLREEIIQFEHRINVA
ncbi:MAG: cell division protein ZipA C-terminal FtsZ-binding domain-containing protein, partial [Woeseiaceae bacterium]